MSWQQRKNSRRPWGTKRQWRIPAHRQAQKMLGVAAIGWIMAFGVPAFDGSFEPVKSLGFALLFTGAAAFSWMLSASTALGAQMWRHRVPRRGARAHMSPIRVPDDRQRTLGNPLASGRLGKRTIALALSLVVLPPAAVLIWRQIQPAPVEASSATQSQAVDGRSAVIVDGDTIGFGSERIRILNIDAPESYQPNCEKELVAGLKAKERLAQLVRAGMIVVQREGKDRYGRTLARLSVDGRDIGETLVREGFALPWQEGAQAKQARTARWCT